MEGLGVNQIYSKECCTVNMVGIDVSKGKKIVSVQRPFNETAANPFEVCHTCSELK